MAVEIKLRRFLYFFFILGDALFVTFFFKKYFNINNNNSLFHPLANIGRMALADKFMVDKVELYFYTARFFYYFTKANVSFSLWC